MSPEQTSSLGEPGDFGYLPIRGYKDFKVVVSDGFAWPGPGAKRNGKGHLGNDFMLRRHKSGGVLKPDYVRHFWCPSNTIEAISPCPGTVLSVKLSVRNGWVVKVSHGRHMTVHRHLSKTCVSPGQEIEAGQAVGIVGHAPSAGKNGINHNHFEIWDLSKPGKMTRLNKSIDPGPYVKGWVQLS